MPENANFLPFSNKNLAKSPALVDAQRGIVAGDAVSSSMDISAAAVVKAAAGKLARIVIQDVGTAGAFTLNDVATVAGAAAANQIASIAYNATGVVAGVPIVFEWPCANGIVVSTVTTGGVIAVSYV